MDAIKLEEILAVQLKEFRDSLRSYVDSVFQESSGYEQVKQYISQDELYEPVALFLIETANSLAPKYDLSDIPEHERYGAFSAELSIVVKKPLNNEIEHVLISLRRKFSLSLVNGKYVILDHQAKQRLLEKFQTSCTKTTANSNAPASSPNLDSEKSQDLSGEKLKAIQAALGNMVQNTEKNATPSVEGTPKSKVPTDPINLSFRQTNMIRKAAGQALNCQFSEDAFSGEDSGEKSRATAKIAHTTNQVSLAASFSAHHQKLIQKLRERMSSYLETTTVVPNVAELVSGTKGN